MYKLIKCIIIILKNWRNKISFSSDISLNTTIGIHNKINKSRIYNSKLSNGAILNRASVFSSTVGDKTKIVNSNVYSGTIADNVSIGENSLISNSTIKRYTYLAGNSRLFNTKVGAFCSIAENVSIGHSEHPYTHLSTSPVFYSKSNAFGTTKFLKEELQEFNDTIIGNDVWIGFNSYIKSGVTIGDGSIIGAGSVVTKDVPSYSIVAGVPARLIKKRFEEDKISKYIKDCWWDLSEDALVDYLKTNW